MCYEKSKIYVVAVFTDGCCDVFVKPVDYLNIYGVEYGKNSIQL